MIMITTPKIGDYLIYNEDGFKLKIINVYKSDGDIRIDLRVIAKEEYWPEVGHTYIGQSWSQLNRSRSWTHVKGDSIRKLPLWV